MAKKFYTVRKRWSWGTPYYNRGWFIRRYPSDLDKSFRRNYTLFHLREAPVKFRKR